MFSFKSGAIVALGLALLAPAAQAATFTGITPGGTGVYTELMSLQRGVTYRVDAEFDRPVYLGVLQVYTLYNFQYFDRLTGNFVFGDHIDIYPEVKTFTGEIPISFEFTAPQNHTVTETNYIIEKHYTSSLQLVFDAYQGAPVHWRVDVTRVSPAPEPHVWALMILGFGAVGSTMRRNRSKPLPAAA